MKSQVLHVGLRSNASGEAAGQRGNFKLITLGSEIRSCDDEKYIFII